MAIWEQVSPNIGGGCLFQRTPLPAINKLILTRSDAIILQKRIWNDKIPMDKVWLIFERSTQSIKEVI